MMVRLFISLNYLKAHRLTPAIPVMQGDIDLVTRTKCFFRVHQHQMITPGLELNALSGSDANFLLVLHPRHPVLHHSAMHHH